MRSFKKYSKTQNSEKPNAQTAEELTAQIANAYHGKSSAEMLKNVLLQAEQSKRAGMLSNEEIENFYQSFSPMLDSAQRKKLRAIVDKLKEI